MTLTRKLPRPLDSRTAGAAAGAFAPWTTHAPGAADVLAAIELHERAQISFWDAMMLRSAAALDCDLLYTEDLSAGRRYDGVLVVDPFAS